MAETVAQPILRNGNGNGYGYGPVEIIGRLIRDIGFPVVVSLLLIYQLIPIVNDLVKAMNYTTWTIGEVQKQVTRNTDTVEQMTRQSITMWAERQREHEAILRDLDSLRSGRHL